MSTPTIPARAAYRSWADTYDTETVVSALDERAVQVLTPPLAGQRLLDAACGTGRRIRSTDAVATGIDLVFEMLSVGRANEVTRLACADMNALPFGDASFDVVWCRLALGHLATVENAYRELARVSTPGGTLVVSDLHSAAAHAGHARSFRERDGTTRNVEHFIHDEATHTAAAARSGLQLVEVVVLSVGPEVRPFYENAGKRDAYEAQIGLPLLLALRFKK